MRADYPTASDLQAYLTGAGLMTSPPSAQDAALDLQLAVDSARQSFENTVKRRIKAVTQTRAFDWPLNRTGLVFFNADLAAPTSILWGGRARTDLVEYRLGPQNADDVVRPFRWLQLLSYGDYGIVTVGEAAISITGLWGYSDGVPDDVFAAILYRAAQSVMPDLESSRTGAGMSELTRIRIGPVEYAYGGGTSSTTKRQRYSEQTWQDAVDNYRVDMN